MSEVTLPEPKAFRDAMGATQEELADLLGIDRTQISKAENGQAPRLYQYALLGLQVSLDGETPLPPLKKRETVKEKVKEDKPVRRGLGRPEGAKVHGMDVQ